MMLILSAGRLRSMSCMYVFLKVSIETDDVTSHIASVALQSFIPIRKTDVGARFVPSQSQPCSD